MESVAGQPLRRNRSAEAALVNQSISQSVRYTSCIMEAFKLLPGLHLSRDSDCQKISPNQMVVKTF